MQGQTFKKLLCEKGLHQPGPTNFEAANLLHFQSVSLSRYDTIRHEAIFEETSSMEMSDYPSWGWGLSLIALTTAIDAAAVVMMAFAAVRIRVRLEMRSPDLWNLIAILICMAVAAALLLAVLHGIECGIWAAAYLWLGALDSRLDALLFSLDSMSTRGASGLTLERHWQLMGGLEAVNGMLLFGVSTAYLFAVMQVYWSMLAARVVPDARRT